MKKKLLLIMISLILVITIGYAVLNATLSIKGNAMIGNASFNIHFANVDFTEKSIEPSSPISINEEGNQIEFQVSFSELNSEFEFTTDIVNEGTIDGQISKIEITELTSAESHMLDFESYYTNNEKPPAIGDIIKAGESINLTVNVKYYVSDELTNEEYNSIKNGFEKRFIIKITYEAI